MTTAIESPHYMTRDQQLGNTLTACAAQADDGMQPPLYFPVSLLKLTVMSVCTMGLYELFWFYRNWRLIKAREESETAPVWNVLFSVLRAFVFPVFFCYSLFIRIQDTADGEEVPISLASGFLASGWILATLLSRLPDAYWLLPFLSVIFLLPVQSAVNSINQTVNPRLDSNRRFSWWNIATIIAGVTFIMLAITGTTLLNDSIDAIWPDD